MVVLSTARIAGVLSLLTMGTSAIVLEKMGQLPVGWKESDQAAPDTPLTLQIGLQMQNLDQLESKLLDVSTPGSANYGKHLTADQVNSLFAPAPEGAQVIMKWLSDNGVKGASSDGAFISFPTTVKQANDLLGADFKYFVDGSGNSKIRTGQYGVPDNVAKYVDIVSPTTYLGTVRANAVVPQPKLQRKSEAPCKRAPTNSTCAKAITPECLKEIYNVGDYKPDPKAGSRIGFGSFLNQSANYKDLAQFQTLFNIPQQSFAVKLINGGINNQTQDEAINGEANLDVQYISGLSHPLPITEFITGGSPPIIPNVDEPAGVNQNEPYLPYYQYLLSKSNDELPQVITNSYGDDEQTVPFKYAQRVCNMIGMLGLRGISVLESSGDTGVGAACRANDGSNKPRFTPQFPGTCPYITAVGGTQAIYPEVAWVAGSGGFSDYFQQPYYQHDAVNTYLTKHVSQETLAYYKPFFNASGRGFPDVSAHSLTPDYTVIYEGKIAPSGGTSAACPVFGALVAQLNDARFKAGKPSLGFLNPWLYLVGKNGLTDITGGQSDGCTGINGQTGAPVPGGGIIPGAHWNATQGWDPVTGLGVPNFKKLVQIALKY